MDPPPAAMLRDSLPVERQRAIRSWRDLPWRPVPFILVLGAAFAIRRGAEVDVAASTSTAALVEVLRGRQLELTVEDVTWLTGKNGVAGSLAFRGRALVRARTKGEPSDLYLAEARLSPEGALLDVGSVWNITRTSGVDEARPVLRGDLAATVASVDGVATAVHTLDLKGRKVATYIDFTRVQRAQVALANLQQTGQSSGVVHDTYTLDPVADIATVSFTPEGLLAVKADDRAVLIDTQKHEAVDGAGWVRPSPELKAKPGNVVTWSVDRVRSMPWFGEESMQWVKAIAFTGLDYVMRARAEVLGDSSAADVQDALGGVNSGLSAPTYTDPESGWPPAQLVPIVTPPLPGEGQWIALDKDPFITQTPGNPAAFVTSFVRADKQRPQTRIYVTLWDPRQIALHMEAGTVEPVSATGEAGAGVIPRTPEVVRSVVAGFNGGFQAMHGEFGMQANGILYLPPKPYAATVLELRDGTTAFGSWPSASTVPDEVLSYRQNLTALIENEKFNPWGRTWWGGTPKGWADNIHTTRSGVCITKDGFVGYFWGVDISAEVLATSMIVARCTYGVHLDMNPGLAGFEFYNVQPANEYRSIGRPLQSDWESEGTFRDLPDFKYRARRMIKGMQHQNFPQYIHRDARDFFYLTRRPLLPGLDLGGAVPQKEPGEGAWRVKGLPQHGFPYALAITQVRPDAAQPALHVRVLRIDPRTVRPAGSAGTTATTPTIASFSVAQKPKPGELAVWYSNGVFLVGPTPPTPDAIPLAIGVSPHIAHATGRVAVGIQDEDGMLNWVELAPDVPVDEKSSKALDVFLAKVGCSSRVLVRGDPRVLLGGVMDITGAPVPPAEVTGARLVRDDAPGAKRYFDSTEIVGPNVWQPLQSQRVRYFRKPEPKKPSAPPH